MPKKKKEAPGTPFWRRLWPARQRSRRGAGSRWGQFWRNWGVFLVVVALLLAVGLFLLLRSQPPQFTAPTPYRVYFTQGNVGTPAPLGLESEVRTDVKAAQRSVDLATPGLDLAGLADELIAAKERGVEVSVLEDAPNQDDPGVISVTAGLRAAGIPVVVREAPGALGETFVVVDQRLVWAGSWDLSRRGLYEDAGCVVRWDLPQMAEDFHSEFMEMFAEKAYGPDSPKRTRYSHIAILDVNSVSVFMTPEDREALGEVLQILANVRQEIVLVAEEANDLRVGERLIGESNRVNVRFWGVLDPAGASGPVVDVLKGEKRLPLLTYGGSGRMRENFLVVDAREVILFSQRIDQEPLDQNDGFIIVLIDPALAQVFGKEALRMFQQAPVPIVPVQVPPTVPATAQPTPN
jgi:hypothetical protein